MNHPAFKALAASIRKLSPPGSRKLIITSCGPHEGKSTIAVNMSRALAQPGKESVVLIDADPFKPTVHTLLGAKNQRGLGDLLKEVYQVDLFQDARSQFGLGDWIELIQAQSRSGRLTIKQGRETFWVHFDRGEITSFSAQREEGQRLGSLLVGRGHITSEQRSTALKVQQDGHRQLGEVLAGLGYVQPAHLQDALQCQVKECLSRIVALQAPEYEFREVAEPFRAPFAGRHAHGNGNGNGHGNGNGNGNGNGHGNGKGNANGSGMIGGRFLEYMKHPFLTSQIPGFFTDTELENFKVLTAGSVSAELADAAFPLLVQRLEQTFDFVIMDCPPVALTSPTNILSGCTDGVLMVVRADGYEVRLIQQARDQLRESGAKILGVVLNRVNVNQDKALSHYYGAYRL